MILYDGLKCDCGWCGPISEAADIQGDLYCPNPHCTGNGLDQCVLCSKCREEPTWVDGCCVHCHEHDYVDNECECGEIFRRDVA